jgi:hypothetical protein
LTAGLITLAERLGPAEPSFFFEDDSPTRHRR